jgi:hypothetical protein
MNDNNDPLKVGKFENGVPIPGATRKAKPAGETSTLNFRVCLVLESLPAGQSVVLDVDQTRYPAGTAKLVNNAIQYVRKNYPEKGMAFVVRALPEGTAVRVWRTQ